MPMEQLLLVFSNLPVPLAFEIAPFNLPQELVGAGEALVPMLCPGRC